MICRCYVQTFLRRGLWLGCATIRRLSLGKDRKEGQHFKHMDNVHHFAWERVASGVIQFVHCRSEDKVFYCLDEDWWSEDLEWCAGWSQWPPGE
jgi:hypothetical protein